MPSFLTDENAPIYSQSSDILNLVDATNVDFSKRKEPRSFSRTTNDSLDEEVSAESSQASEDSDTRTQMNGTGTRPTSMSSLTNGNSRAGRSGSNASDVDAGPEPTIKPVPNGSAGGTTTFLTKTSSIEPFPGVSIANGASDDFQEGEPAAASPQDLFQKRASVASSSAAGLGSVQQSPIELYAKHTKLADSVVPDSLAGAPSLATIPSSSVPASFFMPSPSLTPAMGTPDPTKRTHSPHRFSSPPVYHSGGTSGTSTPGPLQPPQSNLKHRHTLEVPKATAAGRASRDGMDTAVLASGRFSPTAGAATTGARRTSLSLARRNTRSIHSEVPRDEIIPDDDVLRWAEAYRQKRASKRRKREIEDDDRVLVGTKVDESHENWVTAYNMLTGIRVSVSRTNAKLDRPLTDADFDAKQKSTFDIAGNELVPSAKYDFKFKDYAPWVFRHLRALFRLDPADYLMSLTGKYILSELGSPGKSGSFFYFSRDYKYIIKTIHHAEHKFLRKILKDYYQHVTDNPNTLLSQFYGLHRVKIPYGKKIHFVVMNNLFPPHRDIHQTFDLKGSTIGRDYKEEDLGKNPRATLKDLNWLRRHRHLELGMMKKRLFLEQLNKDVRLLQRLKIMDYSLLIGIHDVQRGNEENLRAKTLQIFHPGGSNIPEEVDPSSILMRTPSKLESARKARELRQMLQAERPVPMGQSSSRMPNELDEGLHRPGFIFNSDEGGFRATHEDNTAADEVYYLGVIDCLTHYGIIKKIEHFWKGLSNDRNQISAQPPDQYGERFINFISAVTMSPEEADRDEARRIAAEEAAAAAQREREKTERDKERVSSWGPSARRKSSSAIPPPPNYNPPPPPPSSAHAEPQPMAEASGALSPPPLRSDARSPEQEATLQRAEQSSEREKGKGKGVPEAEIPDRTLGTSKTKAATVPTVATGPSSGQVHAPPSAPPPSAPPLTAAQILPVLEEAPGEGSSTGGRSGSRVTVPTAASGRDLDDDDDEDESETDRPLTPAKDGQERGAGFGNPIFFSSSPNSNRSSRRSARGNGGGPPTPPKTANSGGVAAAKKPESADSGYGTVGGSNQIKIPLRVRQSVSREELDKALPPLPPVAAFGERLGEGGAGGAAAAEQRRS